MGKKKSVVFMTLITIVILVLCALIAFPKVNVPGSDKIKQWNPVAMQYDLGAEFNGGHYAYYYPQGVITETEYNNNVDALEGDEKDEYVAAYKQISGSSLYFSTDADDCILASADATQVTDGFAAAFNKAVNIITERFALRAAETGSTYRVAVVDKYAIRVDLSATENTEGYTSESYALQAFAQFAKLDKLTIETGTDESTALVSQLQDDGSSVSDLIRSVSIKNKYNAAFLKITFTSEGKEMLETFNESEDTALNIMLGSETLVPITKDYINTKNEVEIGIANEEDTLYADTLCILLNSAMEQGGVDINDKEETPLVLRAPTQVSELNTYAPVYGDVLIWVYVGILALILVALVYSVVAMGGFGVMNIYSALSYFVITALCFAFITGGVFAVTFGSVLVFFAGLLITTVLNGHIYSAIKAEAKLGKTIQSSVKGGYKKTLWTVIDTYAVLVLAAVAMLIGAAGLQTIACQALICIVAGAFCNLLWDRAINVMLLSISKDKYKYFRLVREDDDDE